MSENARSTHTDIADGSGSPRINEDESSVEHRYGAMGRWDIRPDDVNVTFYLTYPLACGHHVLIREGDFFPIYCEHYECDDYRYPLVPIDWDAVWASARPDRCAYRFPDGKPCVFPFGHDTGYHLPGYASGEDYTTRADPAGGAA